jgi:hypothetical protein
MLLDLFTKNPMLMEALKQEGKEVKLDQIVNRILVNSGIQDYEKIVEDIHQDQDVTQNTQALLDQQMQQFLQLTGQQQNVNQIPVQQGGQDVGSY